MLLLGRSCVGARPPGSALCLLPASLLGGMLLTLVSRWEPRDVFLHLLLGPLAARGVRMTQSCRAGAEHHSPAQNRLPWHPQGEHPSLWWRQTNCDGNTASETTENSFSVPKMSVLKGCLWGPLRAEWVPWKCWVGSPAALWGRAGSRRTEPSLGCELGGGQCWEGGAISSAVGLRSV